MLSEEMDRKGKERYERYQRERKRVREAGIDPADDDKLYEAWKDWNEIKTLIIANGGEEVPDKDPLYAVYKAIRKHCINGGFPPSMHLYFIPDDEQEANPGTLAVYKEFVIRINRKYYQKHGTDEDVINTMFHEMMHCKCYLNNKKDTEKEYHLPAFKEVCEENGGGCSFSNSVYGYSRAYLTPESLDKVREELKGA